MSDNLVNEPVTASPRISKIAVISIWIIVIALAVSSLALSAMAYQRSKLDNNTLKSISDITARLEKTADNLDKLAQRNVDFQNQQSNYLHTGDRNSDESYKTLSEKYSNGILPADDGSSKWLFSQDDNK